ncbi:MAG: hypothetical protein GTO33_09555 [Acidobacteria bacterium]|nr:hypothetical protein [Acidobacteriota bacterium]NIO59569.1 hypothetical protein [Acidobacteriota bacterium]NIQ85549.1 hypothetical protein [Acidobacteriota bacterium]NIT11269.1 hypothetical protein [Acidobacteriota bacterium]
MLAFESMRRAGVAIEGVHFDTGFVRETHRDVARTGGAGYDVETIDVRQRYLEEVVAAPRFGYGSGMNPCHDCRAFMLSRADEWAAERGADLLFTGDVVGQRSHDQSHEAFRVAERESGTTGRVLRPLSAEYVDRPDHPAAESASGPAARLQGRSRREQFRLAADWGVTDYPTPSGRCCRLAEPAFARRIRDYLEHPPAGSPQAADIPRLAIGRHFRLAWDLKVILARSEDEARSLARWAPGSGQCRPADRPGPEGRIEGTSLDSDALADVAALVASYTARDPSDEIEVLVLFDGRERRIRAGPASEESLTLWRV